jgi:hypothetical protein
MPSPNINQTYTQLKHDVGLTVASYMKEAKETNREKLICAAMLTGLAQAAQFIANNNCPPGLLIAVVEDVAKGWGLKEQS